MRGYGGGYGRSSFGGGYGNSYGGGYGSSYGSSSSRYGGSSSYGTRASSNNYSGYYTSSSIPANKQGYTQPQYQPKGKNYQKPNQNTTKYGNNYNQSSKQTQPNKNYPQQSQYKQGSSSSNKNNSNYNNGNKSNYSNSNSRYRDKNKTVKNQTINQNVNVNQQQQPRGMFGRFGGGFGRIMKWPLMFMMFDRFRRPRHEPMPPMQQPPPQQHPPIINVYNPPDNQQLRDNVHQQPSHRGTTQEYNDMDPTANQRGLSKAQNKAPSHHDLSPNQAEPFDANKSDSQLIDDPVYVTAADTTRVKITRVKSEPKRLRELSQTPTTEPASSNASSTRGKVRGEETNLGSEEISNYHTNELPSSVNEARNSSKDLSRGFSNQTIGLKSMLQQSPTHEG
ncbi:hypothetical protein KGF57_002276 [Candida theae]|uniref:Uncharacterized protein n=1 Tax=Candida theae TaxID=1198502 RepID=A0AAD5BFB0_9ASCO|nr:uncharacterized protein KGF57_002276 [Candida theae]KAI5958842.1 hypothetical protein KGF57_002276 [Candida theae]